MRQVKKIEIPEKLPHNNEYNFNTYSVREYVLNNSNIYIIKNENISDYSSYSLDDAIEMGEFMINHWDDLEKTIKNIRLKNTITPYEFRILSFACYSGTDRWIKERNYNLHTEIELEELYSYLEGENPVIEFNLRELIETI